MKRLTILALIFACFSFTAACSDDEDDPVVVDESDDNGGDHNETDGDVGDDGEDVLSIGDVGGNNNQVDYRCGSAVIDEWPLNDEVSTGDVDATEDEGVFEITVDASAGGMQGAAENPFIYLRLDGAEKAELTDLEALDSAEWDLAFRRIAFRTNGGDSGPGSVSIAKVVNTTFDDVTQPPADAQRYVTDQSFDEDCEPQFDPIGNLFTALNELNLTNPGGTQSWYDYGAGGGGGVQPTDGDIYVVEIDDRDEYYKLEIISWESGVYTLRIAALDAPIQ